MTLRYQTGASTPIPLPVLPWDPWRALSEDHPNIRVSTSYGLPGNMWGLWNGSTMIWLCKRLDLRARTSTLAHELVHIERGIVGTAGSSEREAEELVVRDISTRRLIPIGNLLSVAMQDPAGTALSWSEKLWGVCRPDVRDRLKFLTPDEWSQMPAAYQAKHPTRQLSGVPA